MSGFLLHLLRHGEPEGPGRLNGHTDARPTAAGIAAFRAGGWPQGQGGEAMRIAAE